MRGPTATVRGLTAAFALLLLLPGCESVLPKSRNEVRSPWASFEEARTAIERIEPHATTAADLRAQGFDPYTSANVQLLNYSDIVLRFPLVGLNGHIDPGLRECLEAGKACEGYSISTRDVRRDRVGNYLQDAFRFKRDVEVSGWNFNALVLLVRGQVVYTLYGGQPSVSEHEVMRQPLGPLQEWGDSVPGLLK
jgi:hypothetical protein